MILASDNWAGAHPKIAASLSAHASGFEPAYGSGDLDKAVAQRFREIFEREVAVFFVATGTAANALSMSACNRVGGVAFCHAEAHMTVDEFGAMGFFTGGARTAPVPGASGRIDPQALDRAITRFSHDLAQAGQPMAVTITQATEIGTVYALDDIAAVSAVAKKHDLPLHMDGARFANALAALDVTPAEMTWKNGVDIVSFGGTKNGCWMAEAVVVLNSEFGRDLQVLRQRAGQLFSKSRFMAAQFEAYLANDLWLETARHANAMAARLARVLSTSNRVRLAWTPQANEVFAIVSREKAEEMRAAGVRFHEWGLPQSFDGDISEGEAIYRFVTSFATTADEVDRFGELVG
jgi:threonine aldolase